MMSFEKLPVGLTHTLSTRYCIEEKESAEKNGEKTLFN